MTGGSDIGGLGRGAGRTRLDWVDALKGIGIIAVVAGHVWTRGPARDAIYAVHMPLFFILSGYTARHIPWMLLLPRLLRSLALPFLSFSIILLGADFLIEGARGVRPIFPDWLSGAATILFATEKLRGPFTILWFIPCLFLARIAWNALIGKAERADAPLFLPLMLIVFALALLAQYRGEHSPLGLLAVPGALLLIWAGALWRRWSATGLVVGTALLLLGLVTLIWFPPLNMKQGDLGWPVLSLCGAVAVAVTLARLAQHMPLTLTVPLAGLGRASLVVMYLHVAFIHYLAPYAPKPMLLLIALAAPWALYGLIRCWQPARFLLLGEARSAS